MALEEVLTSITLPAAADYKTASKQFYCMEVNSSGQALLVTASGARVVGVLQNTPDAAGRAATVTIEGCTKVVAGAVVAAGASLMSDTDGTVITATGANKIIVGTALEGAADGATFRMLIMAGKVDA
jgi:hypothetical protein